MSLRYKKVAIVGMGLMGGSLGMALLKGKIAGEVTGIGRDKKRLAGALKCGAATGVTTDYKEGFSGADIIVFGVPVPLIAELFRDNYRYMHGAGAVTDMGSVKQAVVSSIEKMEKSAGNDMNLFVGSHPMVGSEKAAIKNSGADLYRGGTCIITPTLKTDAKRLEYVGNFWKRLGMNTVEMAPAEHDEKISGVSHLPHLLAFLLSTTQADTIKKNPAIIGNGFKDATRIGASNEEIWSGIFLENKNAVLKDVGRTENELKKLKELIKKQDINGLKKYIRNARMLRESLNK